MTIIGPEIIEVSEGDTRNVSVGLHNALDSGVTLTLSSITEVTSSDLTITNKAINTSTFDVDENGETVTVAIGQGVQFTVAGGNDENSPYKVLIVVTTSASETISYVQQVSFL